MFLCTCLSYLLGQTSKNSFQIFRGFYLCKWCTAYGKGFHCSLDGEQLIVPCNSERNGARSTRIAEARKNGQNYRFSKLLPYPHKDWFKWGISDYFSERWHLRSALMKRVGNRHLTDVWAVLVQGHGRIVAPDFCVAHREANSGLSTLNRTKTILSIYHQQRQLQKQRGMCLNDTYPFCQ